MTAGVDGQIKDDGAIAAASAGVLNAVGRVGVIQVSVFFPKETVACMDCGLDDGRVVDNQVQNDCAVASVGSSEAERVGGG